MRIYEGSPRQDWEEVLRSIGAYADHLQLKELLFVELEPGFILQGLAPAAVGRGDEGGGHLVKKTSRARCPSMYLPRTRSACS